MLNISAVGVTKLVPISYNKEEYLFHYQNLHLHIQFKIKTKKFMQYLHFNKTIGYIHIDTGIRKKSDNDFGKGFFELMWQNNGKFKKWSTHNLKTIKN